MDLDDDIPEEYVDIVAQEFAYDPIRLPTAEDSSQILYNRRTLETIWDTNHIAINPYTRQPFHIRNAIPQIELKQQMCEYMCNNRSVTLSLGLQVIPDYTQILNEMEMKELLNELVFSGNQCLRFLKKKKKREGRRNRNGNGKRKPDDQELEHWKALWEELNLVRLYCEYRAENRKVFSSIEGYKYLFQVINTQLLHSCREYSGSSCDDAKEVCKEVARLVDVMGGLKVKDLLMAPEKSVLAFVRILFDLKHIKYLKIRSMVLRIYRGMFEDCIDYLVTSKENSIRYMVRLTLYVLRESPRDIVNEDLYSGMVILKAAWSNSIRAFDFVHYVDALYMVVIICVSRLKDLHDARHEEAISSSNSSTSSREDDHDSSPTSREDGQEKNNIHLISVALEEGLFLIYSLLTPAHSEEEPHSYTSTKKKLQSMDIAAQIVGMVELVLAGNKFFGSSHLRFGLKITVVIGLRTLRRNVHVQVFRNFLASKFVDEYGTEVKLLLQNLAAPKRSCLLFQILPQWFSQYIVFLLPHLGYR